MKRKITFLTLCAMLFALCSSVAAQQAKVYRVGVIHQGGPYKAVVDGLRDGLRQSGVEEGKHFVLDIRDAKGDLKAVEEAAAVLPATALTLTGPATGMVGVLSSQFTVGANGTISGTVLVTPSAGGGGGTAPPSIDVLTTAQFGFAGSGSVQFSPSNPVSNNPDGPASASTT